MSVPTKGIHVQSAMRYLFRRLVITKDLTAQPESYPRPDMYPLDPHHFGGGSENMKLLYCAIGYIANLTAGRERLINWHVNERDRGHGGGEPLTVSHCQLHLGGHSAIALHATRTDDQQILDLALDWLSIEYYLYALCEVDGEPWTPGARGVLKGKIVGENPTRGKWLRAVREGRSPKPNQYDLGACCISKLSNDTRRSIRDLTTLPKSLTIQGDLSIARNDDGSFSALFATLPLKGGGVRVAGYDGREKWIYRNSSEPGAQARLMKRSGASVAFKTPQSKS